MRSIPMRFWILSALLITGNLAAVCWIRNELIPKPESEQTPLRVVAALPKREVDRAERLSFVMNHEVVGPESLGQPLTQAPFLIEPQPAGHWEWAEPRRLDFVLAAPLPAGQSFRVMPASDIEVQTGQIVQIADAIEFETRPLKLENCLLQSTDREHVTLELRFNQKVQPAALLRHLLVQDANTSSRPPEQGQPAIGSLNPICLVREPAESLVIRCRRPEGTRIRVTLGSALTGAEGPRELGETSQTILEIRPVFASLRAEVPSPGLDEMLQIEIVFSASLDRNQQLPPVKIEPSVERLSQRVRLAPYSDQAVLQLEGEFQPGQRYHVTLSPTLLAESGETLATEQFLEFDIPDREPEVALPARRGVLTPHGNLMLDVRTVNVGGLKLSASQVHANNLVGHLQGKSDRQTSRKLAELTIPLAMTPNVPTTQILDLRKLVENPRGLYRIEAAATDQTWTRDAAIIAVTDLAITLKRERDKFVVWVTSVRTAKPVVGARLTSISYNNQQLATAETAVGGTATLPADPGHPDGLPWVILAELGDDLAYLRVDQNPWMLDDIDQGGRSAPLTYDVMIYAERGVYRPGDTIHLTGIVRDAQGGIPSAFPLSISVTRPDGRTVANLPVSIDPARQGTFQLDYPTREEGQTGPYRFVATLPGDKESLGATQTLVEAFVPVRLAVEVEPAKTLFGLLEPPTATVSARYLFGQPAADLTVTTGGSFERIPLRPAADHDYIFGDFNQANHVEIPPIRQQLDADGKATVNFVAPKDVSPGLWKARLTATVSEDGGRSVSRQFNMVVATTDRHLGLKLAGGKLVPVAQPVEVSCIQRNSEGNPAEIGAIDVALSRVEYDTVFRRAGGHRFWSSTERVIPVTREEYSAEMLTEKQGKFMVTCPSTGSYRLRVVDRTSGSATQLEFYASAAGNDRSSISMTQPERLEILLDQPKYVPGGLAKAVVKSPFAGTLWLTVETDRVLFQHVVTMTENTHTVEIPVGTDLRGGAFVSASVVRSVDPLDQSWLPHRACGLARLVTDHAASELPLTLEIPGTARPAQTVNVTARTNPPPADAPAFVHLWAVDEGILLTSAYVTPDPHRHFFAQRKRAVSTADIFAELLPDHRRPDDLSRIGGDSENEVDALRRNPIPAKRRAAAIVWHTLAPVDSAGLLQKEITLPEFTGELRWMATVVSGDRYGSAEARTTVTTPLLVESTWPRFAAPDDTLTVPVKLFNSTPEPLTVQIELTSTGPISVALPAEKSTAVVPPREPTTIWLDATATGIGAATVKIQATAPSTQEGMLVATARAEFPVRPPFPLHTETRLLEFEAGNSAVIPAEKGFLAGQAKRLVSVSGRPLVQIQPAVDQLLDYPYGCLEQTSSRLFALLSASDLLGIAPDGESRQKVAAERIAAGISRLWAMQTRSGGLGYWPGDHETHLWGTAYAAEALREASERGHAVDTRFVEELSDYLQAALDGRTGDELDDNLRAQICHILAGFDQPPLGWLARLSEGVPQLDLAGRAHLAGAWLRAGRKDRAREVLVEGTLNLTTSTQSGRRMTSQIQQEAQLLNVLLDLDRDHPWIPRLVQKLEVSRKQGMWGNTLENASALTAFARYLGSPKEPESFNGKLEDVSGNRFPFAHTSPVQIPFTSLEEIKLESEGTGKIYVTASTTGIPLTRPAPYDRGLLVRRAWKHRDGTAVDPATLHVGDLITVEVTLQAPGVHNWPGVENVAVLDLLPAGLEVENPRLATSAPGDVEFGEADHVEFLDDRVVLFCSAQNRMKRFHYQLRVTTPGSFVNPPIQASSMYDSDFSSLATAGTVQIAR